MTTSSPSPYEPQNVTVARDLRQRIIAGEWGASGQLPTERELCTHYDVSAITVRAAIARLKADGLVESKRGAGTFVRRQRQLVRLSPQRYSRPHIMPTWEAEARLAQRDVQFRHHVQAVDAPPEIAERLNIDPGEPVQRIVYHFTIDGEPSSMSTCWEPRALTGGTPIEDPHAGPRAGRGIVPRFELIGYHVTEVHEVVKARMPTPDEAQALQIEEGSPVAAIMQTFWAGEVPVQTADLVYVNGYELHFRMPIPPDAPVDDREAATEGETMWPWGIPI